MRLLSLEEKKDDAPSAIQSIKGIWDLVMIGGGMLSVESKYQQITDGSEVTGVCLDGVFLEDESGATWQLQECFDEDFLHLIEPKNRDDQFFPPDRLPEDATLVIRTASLSDFILSVASREPKPVTTKERTTLLTIIGLLAREAGIDLNKPSKAAGAVISLADSAGIKIGQRTVEEYLKKVPEALETRQLS